MNKSYNPIDVELFMTFRLDIGHATNNPLLIGQSLWHFRPIQKSNKTINFNAISQQESQRKHIAERKKRAAKLTALCTHSVLTKLEQENISVLSLLT